MAGPKQPRVMLPLGFHNPLSPDMVESRSFNLRAASSRAYRELKSICILHAHTCSARRALAKMQIATESGPPRQVLTCRVKSEDLHRKQTAPIHAVVFNFLTLSVMHGHNRWAEIAFPGRSAPARKRGVIMRRHTLQREQIEDAWWSRRSSLRHRQASQAC